MLACYIEKLVPLPEKSSPKLLMCWEMIYAKTSMFTPNFRKSDCQMSDVKSDAKYYINSIIIIFVHQQNNFFCTKNKHLNTYVLQAAMKVLSYILWNLRCITEAYELSSSQSFVLIEHLKLHLRLKSRVHILCAMDYIIERLNKILLIFVFYFFIICTIFYLFPVNSRHDRILTLNLPHWVWKIKKKDLFLSYYMYYVTPIYDDRKVSKECINTIVSVGCQMYL